MRKIKTKETTCLNYILTTNYSAQKRMRLFSSIIKKAVAISKIVGLLEKFPIRIKFIVKDNAKLAYGLRDKVALPIYQLVYQSVTNRRAVHIRTLAQIYNTKQRLSISFQYKRRFFVYFNKRTYSSTLLPSLRKLAQFEPAHCLLVNECNNLLYTP